MPDFLFTVFLGGVALELAVFLPVLRVRRPLLAVGGAVLVSPYAWRDADFTLLAGAWLLAFAGWRSASGRGQRP